MKLDLSFAELHTSLFIGGVNWGLKLYQKQAKGLLVMAYDRTEKELLISFKDPKGVTHVSIVPTSNVVSMVPVPSAISLEERVAAPVLEAPNPHVPAKKGIKRDLSSQAQSPNDHVFGGEGAGKTNDR